MKYRISSVLTVSYKLVGLLLIAHSFSLMFFFYNSVNVLLSFLYCILSIPAYKWIASYKKVSVSKNGLYISNLWKEIHIPFSTIESVTNPANIATAQVTIILFDLSPFGKKIRFAPKFFQAKTIAKKLQKLLLRKSIM